jgi:DNA-binding HxlR family transcriptional regulator
MFMVMAKLDPQHIVFHCNLPAALETMGERWSFLILRGAFNGISHFEQFQSSLGIARNILSNRLGRLVERGILERHVDGDDRRKVHYMLTKKGEALLPTLIALRQWADRWEGDRPSNPVLVDRRDRKPVRDVMLIAQDGRSLARHDLTWMDRSEFPEAPADRG